MFDGANTIKLTAGTPSDPLDRLLGREKAQEWGFLTAENPGSHLLAPTLNAARNRGLEQKLVDERRTFYRGLGIGQTEYGTVDETWPPEQSFLILDVFERGDGPEKGEFRSVIQQLARAYGQRAFVYGERGGAPQIVDSLSGEVL